MKYIWSNLSPEDFEILCQDIISALVGERFERFKGGKDGGIDLRLLDSGSNVIVQVKHCLGSYNAQHKSMLTKELASASGRFNKGERYILISSIGLSALNKAEITKFSNGLIKKDDDIIGIDEIEDFLEKNPLIVRRHYKLWISSSNVLTRLLNNGVYGKSEDYLEAIRTKIKLFVQTEKFADAEKILSENNILLITGEPGVGKTTLAEILSMSYVNQEYEFVYVDDIDEAEHVFEKELNQIFVLDDFLGSNYLEFIEGKSESKILRFMERVKIYKNKKLILSTRTTIFNNALLKGIHLNDKSWDGFNCILEIGDYSLVEKAQLLYNHLAFRGLECDYLENIKVGKKYHQVVKHKNFNPRVIEFITSSDKIQGKVGDEYVEFVQNSLDNPSAIWEPAYRSQINDESRLYLQSLLSLGGAASESNLKRVFERRQQIEAKLGVVKWTDSPFNNATKLLLGGFISRTIISGAGGFREVHIRFVNPSITDFLVGYFRENDLPFGYILDSIAFVEQIGILLKLNIDSSKVIKSQKINEIIVSTGDYDSISRRNVYAALLHTIVRSGIEIGANQIGELFEKAIASGVSSNDVDILSDVLEMVIDRSELEGYDLSYCYREDNIRQLLLACTKLDDLEPILNLAARVGLDILSAINNESNDIELREAIQDILENEAESMIEDDSELNSEYDPENVEYRLRKLNEHIHERLFELGVKFDYKIDKFSSIDPQEVAYENFKASERSSDYQESLRGQGGNDDADIDNVFKV